MRLLLCALTVLTCAATAQAQAVNCRHLGLESPEARESREDALAAVRMINSLLAQAGSGSYPEWEELGKIPPAAALMQQGGRAGDLARKIEWGSAFPLPNWRIHYIAEPGTYAFSLVDTADACGLTYSTNDTGVIAEGYPVGRRRGGIVPITE